MKDNKFMNKTKCIKCKNTIYGIDDENYVCDRCIEEKIIKEVMFERKILSYYREPSYVKLTPNGDEVHKYVLEVVVKSDSEFRQFINKVGNNLNMFIK